MGAERPPRRVDGYAPIEDYAAIGDGRVVALVARDGAIDWLCIPTMDRSAVFSAILDADRGGAFALRPTGDYRVTRRYAPRTNVLETTFTTSEGTLRVTDALTLQDGGVLPWIELVRKLECLAGRVEVRWECRPRFDSGRVEARLERLRGVPVARGGRDFLALLSWEAGDAELSAGAIAGGRELSAGEDALVACVIVDNEPLPVPPREEIEVRIGGTVESWRRWIDGARYDGPWREAVERSALALKLLTYAPSGAMAAAATTSLPEAIGGSRNYDYRFSWIRDSAFAIDALGRLGFREQAHESLSWLLDASESTHPRLEPLYSLDAKVPKQQSELPLAGYRGTRPVNVGNSASGQLQLGTYGDLLETIRLYVDQGNALDAETARRVVESCDFLVEIWRNADSGFWELPENRQYTLSKLSAWGALDRALGLWQAGQIQPDVATLERWKAAQKAIREFVETECWSDEKRSYTLHAGTDRLDAGLLLNARIGYVSPDDARMTSTIDAVREELSAGGPLLYRFTGMETKEGAFVACSFWLVTALVRAGREEEAREQMEAMLERANDVGLYSEEIDPATGSFLGNFPQALSHLALVNAAAIFHQVTSEGRFPARAAAKVSR